MKRNIRVVFQRLRRCVVDLRALYAVRNSGYLFDNGWWDSSRRQDSIDAAGNPIPWFTYPCIEFLRGRISMEFDVFEYGSGNSTRWWANRVGAISSCEHDESWYDKVRLEIPSGATVVHRELVCGDYSSEITKYENRFDIVVIDGRDRVSCARNCVKALKSNGVIIWDDTERSRYSDGLDYLESLGFRRLDFWGIGPIAAINRCTSVLYRDENCLNI
ncbi:MAG: class I SAM-dependent methyltransferase [Candidatus Geothermincolia bacterium]